VGRSGRGEVGPARRSGAFGRWRASSALGDVLGAGRRSCPGGSRQRVALGRGAGACAGGVPARRAAQRAGCATSCGNAPRVALAPSLTSSTMVHVTHDQEEALASRRTVSWSSIMARCSRPTGPGWLLQGPANRFVAGSSDRRPLLPRRAARGGRRAPSVRRRGPAGPTRGRLPARLAGARREAGSDRRPARAGSSSARSAQVTFAWSWRPSD